MKQQAPAYKKILLFTILSFLILSVFIPHHSLASGPKSVYGTLYVGGQIAPAGIDIKLTVDNQTFTKKTVTWNTYNYIIGLPPGYEGKTAYFFIGVNNVIPLDNTSFPIGSAIEYIYNLHVNNLTQNQVPTAKIDSITPNPAAYNQTIQFTGQGTDQDGTITAYHWRSSLQGNLSTNQSFSLTNMQRGEHTIYFKVKDNNNTWSPEVSQLLRITHYNKIPKATIDYVQPQQQRINKNVSFKGHGNDTDGTITSYQWRSNRSGTLSNQASFNTSTLTKGNHTIYFKVMDNTSYWSAEVSTYVVIVDNLPPTARINAPSQAEIDVAVQFDGRASTDPDGTIVAWFWDFGDGTNSTSPQPTHTYTEIRTYQIKLTVTDDSQATANTTHQISIAEAEPENNKPGTATIEGPTEGNVGTSIEFTLTASDPDFDSVYFRIDWGDDEDTMTEFTPSSTPLTVNHTWTQAGTFTINVTTIDTQFGLSGIVSHEIKISEGFLAGIPWYLLVLPIIVVIALVLMVFILRRRQSSQPPMPAPMVMNEEIPQDEDYNTYYDQPAELTTPLPQPIEQPSGFKRI